jgi:hypothetical protein
MSLISTCYSVQTQTPWPQSARDPHLSAKLVAIFADSGCHVVSVMGPYDRILGFLDLYIFI